MIKIAFLAESRTICSTRPGPWTGGEPDCNKLPTWKASMMARAGRLALTRSVLAAIPLHQLIVLSLNKKALKHIIKIMQGFLSVGRATLTAATAMSTGLRSVVRCTMMAWGTQTSHARRSVSGSVGFGRCVPTPVTLARTRYAFLQGGVSGVRCLHQDDFGWTGSLSQI